MISEELGFWGDFRTGDMFFSFGMNIYTQMHYYAVKDLEKNKNENKSQLVVNLEYVITYVLLPKMQTVLTFLGTETWACNWQLSSRRAISSKKMEQNEMEQAGKGQASTCM